MAPLFLELSSAPGDITLPTTSPCLWVLMAPLLLPVLGSSLSWLVPLTMPTPLLQHAICFLPGPFVRQLHATDRERSSITQGLLKILGRSKITFSCHNWSYSSSQVISQTFFTMVPLPMLTSFQIFYPWSHSSKALNHILPHSSKALDHNVAKSY